MKKQKIVNDPVHGFISIRSALAYEIIEHPYFQRLRGVKQLGLTHMVYPGACHTRFQHALGAMHLMGQAIEALRAKGHHISSDEAEAAECAMLLHDIGHGPFSHALEFSLVEGVAHEHISAAMMHALNREMGGRLDLTLAIFGGSYPKNFLHRLVSSQLDVDRLDYLLRDSFFSGVAEGAVGVERIIKMLEVVNDELVVEEKGIHSVEKFLIARSFMYWQVYLHKAVIAAEQLLVNIFARAKALVRQGEPLPATEALQPFLAHDLGADLLAGGQALPRFVQLADCDVDCAVKAWGAHPDRVLRLLCRMLAERRLPKVDIRAEEFEAGRVATLLQQTAQLLALSSHEAAYFTQAKALVNRAYSSTGDPIMIVQKNGALRDIYEVSDMLNATAFRHATTKHFLCHPKEVDSEPHAVVNFKP
ncbi:MAG: HD domain-containing protein [Prevotellaceae bacterium]|jgi:HD superfamily phosphohydrolase|nr:HD domain-containing protein [Prevotellaceae bacterium]